MKPTLQAVDAPSTATPARASNPEAALEALGLDADFVDSDWLAQHGDQLAGMLDVYEEPGSVTLPGLPAAA